MRVSGTLPDRLHDDSTVRISPSSPCGPCTGTRAGIHACGDLHTGTASSTPSSRQAHQTSRDGSLPPAAYLRRRAICSTPHAGPWRGSGKAARRHGGCHTPAKADVNMFMTFHVRQRERLFHQWVLDGRVHRGVRVERRQLVHLQPRAVINATQASRTAWQSLDCRKVAPHLDQNGLQLAVQKHVEARQREEPALCKHTHPLCQHAETQASSHTNLGQRGKTWTCGACATTPRETS